MKFADRILTLEEAIAWRQKLAMEGKKLAVTNGCFDLLHVGHVEYLATAATHADKLLILINSDASVRKLKGESRPVNSQISRAIVLAALRSVSRVVIFNSERCDKELAALKPDVYVKAGDYSLEKLDSGERAALESSNSKMVFVPFVDGFSTTETLDKLKK